MLILLTKERKGLSSQKLQLCRPTSWVLHLLLLPYLENPNSKNSETENKFIENPKPPIFRGGYFFAVNFTEDFGFNTCFLSNTQLRFTCILQVLPLIIAFFFFHLFFSLFFILFLKLNYVVVVVAANAASFQITLLIGALI